MDTKVSEVEINGVAYVRKDSVAEAVPTGERHIVVLDRGWVFCGNVIEDSGRVYLRDAVHVLRWEGIGFGGLVAEEDPSKIKTKPVKGLVDFPLGAEVFRVPVSASWGK